VCQVYYRLSEYNLEHFVTGIWAAVPGRCEQFHNITSSLNISVRD
jgi:hypothetical protein